VFEVEGQRGGRVEGDGDREDEGEERSGERASAKTEVR